jgi:hypothetical protein
MLLAVCAAALALGCVQKRTPPPVPEERIAYDQSQALGALAESQQYYRDDSGRLYQVDSRGGLHMIDRRVRVEPGTGGLYSIVDDNNVRYFYDDAGRLFFRDETGRLVYVEEGSPTKSFEPLPVLRGKNARAMRLRSVEFCNSDWNKCEDRCDSPPVTLTPPAAKRPCLESCDRAREQCLLPY